MLKLLRFKVAWFLFKWECLWWLGIKLLSDEECNELSDAMFQNWIDNKLDS